MRIAMGLEYDGTGFAGWETQVDQRTVQSCAEAAVAKVADHPVKVVCAGRTDSGVHALSQVVHFDSEAPRDNDAWLLGTNANLPADIRVRWAQPVDNEFHARFSARRRSYRFVILNARQKSALHRHRVCWHYRPLDDARMAGAAQYLIGEHDFSSYRAQACQAKNPVRTIYRLDVSRHGEFVHIDVVANAFLHHMVRNIAGVLMAVGEGKYRPDWAGEVLGYRDRTLGGVTAPPQGLYLLGVEYPQHYRLPACSARSLLL